MKIILATDGSIYSQTAAKEAAGQFPANAEVHIISAYEKTSLLMHTEPHGALREFYAEVDQKALKSAQDATEHAARILKGENQSLSISTAVVEGSAKNVILKEAEAFGADLIVVGSHGHGAVQRFLLGSVSQSVALHATCSVLIVRGKTKNN